MARHMRNAKRANKSNFRFDDYASDKVVDFYDNSSRTQKRYRKDYSQNSEKETKPVKKVEIVPRNLAQEQYLEMLNDENKCYVFSMGPAGTGKTLLATLYAIQQYQEGNINKIIITRPAVSVDEQHGFLPGTLIDKMAPWVIPIMDIFKEFYSVKAVEKMLEDEIIEIAPLSFMRGRTFKNVIIIADEMQNATPNQMKMLLTRIGENSRMFITGDLHQHDRGYESNGLKDFVSRLELEKSEYIAVCKFTASDVERHPAIEDILRIYKD